MFLLQEFVPGMKTLFASGHGLNIRAKASVLTSFMTASVATAADTGDAKDMDKLLDRYQMRVCVD